MVTGAPDDELHPTGKIIDLEVLHAVVPEGMDTPRRIETQVRTGGKRLTQSEGLQLHPMIDAGAAQADDWTFDLVSRPTVSRHCCQHGYCDRRIALKIFHTHLQVQETDPEITVASGWHGRFELFPNVMRPPIGPA